MFNFCERDFRSVLLSSGLCRIVRFPLINSVVLPSFHRHYLSGLFHYSSSIKLPPEGLRSVSSLMVSRIRIFNPQPPERPTPRSSAPET